MTTLAEQLQKLATSQTQSLLGSRDLSHASFLYNYKEAATYDRQHFYNIGINGLQQLMRRDERFKEFEQSLFSPSSQAFQRFVQTSETNTQLDEAITRFLVLLSPFMQLREAHKALEWLVYRYQIHLRNVDALMMCVLPYHDQEPFIMALRMLKLNTNECVKWRWLEPVKKGNMFLARQTLVTHCRSARGFLGFICDMLDKHVEVNVDDESGHHSAPHLQRVIAFYTQTVLGVLMSGPPSESILSTLIPSITTGLKSRDLPDRIVSSYMILGHLLMHADLNGSLLKSFLNVIAKNIQPSLLNNALMVIIIMFQKQSISKVAKKAFKYLSQLAGLPQMLADLSRGVNTEPFLTPFLEMLTHQVLKECRTSGDGTIDGGGDQQADGPLLSLLMDMLKVISLEHQSVAVVARTIISSFIETETEEMEVDGHERHTGSAFKVFQERHAGGAFKVFRFLENKYSSILEKVVEEITAADTTGQTKKVVRNLYKLSVCAARKDLTSDPVTFLTVCLHHRNSSVRRSAVDQLLHDMTLMEDKQAVQSALALRLQDHEPGVVQAVLQAPQKLWDLFDDKRLLYQGLLQKLQTFGGKSEISPAILSQVLQTLCHVPESAALPAEVTVIILSFLFPNTDGHLGLAECLLQSPVTSWNTLLAHIARDWLPEVLKITQDSQKRDIEQLVQLCHKLVQTVAHYFDDQAETCLSVIKSLYESLTATPQRATAALLLLLVTEMLSQQNSSVGHVSERVRAQLQHQLVHFLSDLSLNKCMVQSHKSHSIKAASTLPANHAKSLEDRIEAYLSHVPKELSSLSNDVIIDILSRLEWAPAPCQLQEVIFWDTVCHNSLEADWLQLMTTGVNFLLDLAARKSAFFSTPAQQLCETFFKVFGDAKSVVKFLCMLWTSPPVGGLTSAQEANVLQFSQVYFTSLSDAEVLSVFNETTPVLPCLLILLSNKCERVRSVAFSILASLARETVDDASNLRWLAASLLQYREEVTKDCEFLAQVLKNILEGESEVTISPAKKRRRASSKPPPQTAALNYLLNLIGSSHVSANTKAKLLAVLHQLDTVDSFLSLVPLLRQLLARTGETPASSDFDPQSATQEITAIEREMIGLLLKRFTQAVAGCVDSSTDALPALMAALSCTAAGAAGADTVQTLAASRLKKRFMGSLPAPSRQAIFSQLLNVLTSNSDSEMGKCCKKAIKRMALESSIITEELKPILAISGPGTIREAKRIKHKQTSELDSPPWQRAVILLELIQNKKNLTNAVSLVPVMFQVLGRVLELEDKGSGEYIKQLVLGAVNFICERHQTAQPTTDSHNVIRGEHLNMDLIVQCIRSSDNPHTHHQALLLLCVAAKISPDLLLHNMMTVFTFMGANILRQDDAYSFHVIGKILENVIPALIMACEEKSKDKVVTRKTSASSGPSTGQHSHTEGMMTAVLRVFVDAIPHIPAHRKMMLFEKLLNVVGVEKYFWRLILLFIESITVRSSKPAALDEPAVTVPEEDKSSGPVTASDLEFLTSLADKFSGCQLLQSLNQALNYALHLPEEKQNDGQEDEAVTTSTSGGQNATDVEIFCVLQHSAKQLRHFKFALVFVLNHLVSSQHLIAQLAGESSSTFLPGYQGLMETILQFIGQVTQSHQRHKDEQSSRFWRLLRNKSHDLLDQLVSLLPDHLIMDVVLGLMSHSLPLVQRRAMDLLNSKLQHYKDGLTPNQTEMLLSVTKKLQTIVRHCLLKSSKKSGGEEENLINGQTALYSLKILCRILGQRNHQRFIEVLKTCVKVMSKFKHNSLVMASAMLCVAEVVSSVNVHSIEHLGEFMPLVISQLQSEDIIRHEVLLLASVTSLQKIIEAVPMFLSPYLKDILVQVCVISSVMEAQAESQKPALIQKVKMICTTLATVTPTRTFLPVLEKCLSALEDRLALCAENAMCMLKDHIVRMAREDLTTFSQDLLKFFLSCLEIRVNKPEISEEDLNLIEGKLIEAFVALVFKLSEAQFKPMLLQMYGWATAEGVSHDRVLVFYRTCDSLAEKLKSLFTLFAGHIIKHSAEMLDTNNQSKTSCEYFGQGPEARHKSNQLLCFILGCLHKTFSSDTDGFLNKERFDAVMQPLVDQLDNDLGQDSECEDRITNHLVPCLASLAAAARDDTLWKDLNYQICLKTRHENPKVRIWALSAIDAFHKQLGEDYTHLVPETIPFMAELMEDESDEVEKFTQKVLAAMEVSVGENLQEYF